VGNNPDPLGNGDPFAGADCGGTLAAFPSADVDCSGEPLAGLAARPVTLHARTAYTAIAWVKQGAAVGHPELRLQRDFCRPACPIRGTYQDGFHEPRR